ncbi:hypothetical protein EYS14_24465 [Alteromonadaceae bacterium M269]|nr:hypothetical protein EYS14_24465 [Alteromonadaceae bacterium M269]
MRPLNFWGLLTCLYLVHFFNIAKAQDYLGSEVCRSCHVSEYEQWTASDHYKAMQLASPQTVLGDFNDSKVNFHGIQTRFFKKGEHYKITTTDSKGDIKTFDVSHTFGFYPLQQYLIDTDGGKKQAFNIAWDTRDKSEGGQRWFHLQQNEPITPEHPFFWQRHFQNWNSRCAECHSTNLEKRYRVETHTFDTQFSEVNVACESCHGPGQQHVLLAKRDALQAANSGFDKKLPDQANWFFEAGQSIASSSTNKPLHGEINMCGHCHSLRTPLEKGNDPDDLLNDNLIQWIKKPFYHFNGQSQEESFVLGSFLQSKMYQAGVTCSNCHNAHTGKVKIEGNNLCAQCHQSTVYDTPKHHKHPALSTGAQCVNCHMPERRFMVIDGRRDHGFSIPSMHEGEGSVCLNCHNDKDTSWLQANKEHWGKGISRNQSWFDINELAQMLDSSGQASLLSYIANSSATSIRKGTLISEFGRFNSGAMVDAAIKHLKSEDVLIKRAAIESVGNIHPAERWPLLRAHMQDSRASVRYAIAESLVDATPYMSPSQIAQVKGLLNDYRAYLGVTEDSPFTQLRIAALDYNLGNVGAAESAYTQALKITPNYIPILLEQADFYRRTQRDELGEPALLKAIQLEPSNVQANFSLGLFNIRQKRYKASLPYLKTAHLGTGSIAQFSFTYAVALDHQSQTESAVVVLEEALESWPEDQRILITLIQYLEKIGRYSQAFEYKKKLKG